MGRANVTMRWHGPQVVKTIEDEMRRRLPKVGEMVASQVRRNISTSTRANGPSLPGGFPHADTGMLRKSIEWRVIGNGLTVQVGSAVAYAAHLELGTSKMEARPFLRPTVMSMQREISAELRKPTKDSGDNRPGFFKIS